jgi:hypothetical protein
MRLRGIPSALCLALVLAMSLSGLADGAGGKSRVRSTVRFDSLTADGAGGSVSSHRGVCRTQRQVLLYRVNSGPSVPSSERVAYTRTRADGSWAIPGPIYPSEFFAVVQRKSSDGVVCRSAVSNSLHWG